MYYTLYYRVYVAIAYPCNFACMVKKQSARVECSAAVRRKIYESTSKMCM